MEKLSQILLLQETALKKLLDHIAASSNLKSEEGRLRITHKRGKPQYYLDLPNPASPGKRSTHYLPKSNMEKIQALAQRDYEIKLQRALLRQLDKIHYLQTVLNSYDEHALESVYSSMHPSRKALIKPLVMDQSAYTEIWKSRSYTPKPLSDNDTGISTENGEYVRSKSEKIIADKYFKMGIPYRYECPLHLSDRGKRIVIHPDFTVLNTTTRKEIYHEHFGMMDSETYSRAALKRIELYAQNGIFVGDRLIITHETSDMPLSMPYFEQLIDRYLLQ